MSDAQSIDEVQGYLDAMAGGLRLGAVHREAILAELQDHLQLRLEELETQGVKSGVALQRALGELGDASGLAAQFVSIHRMQRRRKMMRWATGSTMAALAAVMAMLTFMPGDGTTLGTRRAEAQDKRGRNVSQEGSTPEENNLVTEKKLAQVIDANFGEEPLESVLQYVSASSDVQIYVNRQMLAEEGVQLDAPVTIELTRVRLSMLLELALNQVGPLAYVVRDGIVIVSTNTDLENATEVRVYNCRDLLAAASGARPRRRGGGGMSEGGYGDFGSGSAYGEGGYGEGLGEDPGYGGEGGYGADDGGGGAPAGLGPGGLGPGGLGPGGVGPGGLGPGGMGPPGGLGGGAMAGPGMGMGAEMMGGGEDMYGGYDGGMGMMGGPGAGGYGPAPMAGNPAAAQLIQVIQTTVEASSWQQMGGYGSISEYNGLLVINHNVRVHHRVDKLLNMLREIGNE